mmetsp:Transcript_8455/g.28355  ORF Transcript_8455/g.28355 Transcript_8455/m.28355 type:complete len:270 (-) Transcript_8455:64-873(-)
MTHYDQSQEHDEILSESWQAGGHGPTQLPSTTQNEAGSVITKGVIHDLAATTVWDSWREKRINAEFFYEYLRNSQCTCAGWSYDMRRVAQEIIPEKLWLGPLAAARKYSALMSCGITHIVLVRSPLEKIVRPMFPDHISYYCMEISEDDDLQRKWIEAITFMRAAENGKLLVHCLTGLTHSAALVIAYLIARFRIGRVQAVEYVIRRRACIHLTEPIPRLLHTFSHTFLVAYRLAVGMGSHKRLGVDSPLYTLGNGELLQYIVTLAFDF